MISYAEDNGRKVTDWNHVLDNWKTYSIDERWNFGTLSKSWVTCACGNQCDAIPRYETGMPKDKQLYDLGLVFTAEIMFGATTKAKATLEQIEARSIELLKALD